MAQSLLIVKLSSLGDVIHTLPAAQALRAAFPAAHLAWVVEAAHAGVLEGQDWLDQLIVWRRGERGARRALLRELRSRRWELAVDFQGLLRSALVMRLSGARRRIGYAGSREFAHWFYTERVPPPLAPVHAVERSLRLVAPLGARFLGAPLDRPYLRGAAPRPTALPQALFPLRRGAAETAAVDAWLVTHGVDARRARLVVLNPHCRKPANRWPAERFAELAVRLLQLPETRVVLTGGKASTPDCDRIETLVRRSKPDAPLLRADGRFSLLASAELYARAAVFVTGDTGPMHLAAAVGAPLVALFGPADPLRTGPYTTDAAVLREPLECSPCFAREACPLGHDPPLCLERIGVEAVVRAVAARLGVHEISEASGSAVWRKSA